MICTDANKSIWCLMQLTGNLQSTESDIALKIIFLKIYFKIYEMEKKNHYKVLVFFCYSSYMNLNSSIFKQTDNSFLLIVYYKDIVYFKGIIIRWMSNKNI